MRSFIMAVVSAGLVAGAAVGSSAEEKATLALADVLATVRAQSPGLQAAAARAAAASAVPARVRAWDDPTFSWEVFNAPESLRIDHAENNILRLTQRIPFPGKRPLAGEIAERAADEMRSDADRVALDLVVAATRAYVDLWQAHEQQSVYQRDRELTTRLARTATARYAAGDGPQSDVLLAELERTQQRERAATADLALGAARAELNRLLSRPLDAPLGVPEPPRARRATAPLEDLTTQALAGRPELAAGRAAIARGDAGRRLAERNYFPDFELTVARLQNFEARDGFGAMASVSIPLAQRGKYDAALAEANAELDAARADLRRLEDAVRNDVRQAYLRVQTAAVRSELLLGTHLPQTEQLLRVVESDYASGAVDFTALAERLRGLEMAHVDHVQAAAELAKAYADLERAVGGPIDGGVTERGR